MRQRIDKLFDSSLNIRYIIGMRLSVDFIYKMMIDFESFREDKTLKTLISRYLKNTNIFTFTDLNDDSFEEKYQALFSKVNISYLFNGYLREFDEIFLLTYEIKSGLFVNYNSEGIINPNNYIDIFQRSYVCCDTDFKNIFEKALLPELKWKNQLEEIQLYVLNNCNYYIHLDSDDYYELKEKSQNENHNNSVMFGFCKNIDKNVKDVLLDEVNEHIRLVNIHDKDYYYDCDEEYLQGEWLDKLNILKMKLEFFRSVK